MSIVNLLVEKAQAQLGGVTDLPRIPVLQNTSLVDIILRVINTLLLIAGIIAFLYLIIQGISYITAGGDPEKATAARQGVINAVIGIVIIIASFALIRFVIRSLGAGGGFFGF